MAAASLPPDTGIGLVHLTVADLTAASRFYLDVLGFRIAAREHGRTSFSASGETPVHLILSENPKATRRRTAGLYHFAILLPTRQDLARVLRHLIDSGAPIEGASDHGVSEAVYLHDVEGNGIEIYADRPRERWPVRNGTLAMGTDALDVEDLLDHAGQPWDGMPAGTGIGHIHLRVGDLARSERFYAGTLGFEVIVRSYPGALFVSAGGYHHHIGLNTWAGTGIPPMTPEGAGLRYFSITIPEQQALDDAVRRLRNMGGVNDDIVDGPVRGVLARDPDGIGVLLTP
ncbi:MAG: VOC family protein [bacterium]